MNIAKNHVSILVYFYQFSYVHLHWSYIRHEMLDNMYEFIIYIYMYYNVCIGMNIANNYYEILFSTILLINNELFSVSTDIQY